MSNLSEAERIAYNVSGEVPPPVEVRLVCTTRTQSSVGLRRVRDVMALIASRRMSEWPDDSWWQSQLPAWFIRSFEGHSIEDILQDSNLWDFGSWIDAMQETGWEWWSSSHCAFVWTISICVHSDPCSIGPLEYLCRAAGADAVLIK